MKLQNKVAAITGAGSGIGRALALDFASQGCEIAISDVNEAGLEETRKLAEAILRGAHDYKEGNVKVSARRLDVSDRAAVEAWAEFVVAEHGRVNIIVNNAGVGVGSTVEGMNYPDMEWLMSINFWGVIYGSTAFLPFIKKSGEGSVVNISSVAGLIGFPMQSAYSAAKFGVRGFTEALAQELDLEGGRVNAICVHPAAIRTNILRNNTRLGNLGSFQRTQDSAADGFEKLARTSPAWAAKVITRAIRSRRRRVLIGPDAYLIDWPQRLFPRQYQRLMVALTALIRTSGPGTSVSKPNERIGA